MTGGWKLTHSSKGSTRKSRYGVPITEEADVSKKKNYSNTSYPAFKQTFKPVSDETTPYGAKKFRTPTHANQFKGKTGSKQEAIILDIDGTLTTWGAGFDKDTLKWCEKHYKANGDIVFIVVTARDHEYMYESSFNTLMRGFPYAFIGPFCRAKDDPRYASEFKRELCVDLSAIFDIIGAADDNKQVIDMWKQWAIDWFEKPEDFDLLECSYGEYGDWRYGLASKGTTTTYVGGKSTTTSYGKPSTATGTHQGRKWVNGYHVKDANGDTWVSGHYEGQVWIKPGSDPVTGNYAHGRWIDAAEVIMDDAKHRQAGSDRFEPQDLSGNANWGHYLAARYGSKGLNVISESPNEPARDEDALDEVMTELEGLTREDLEGIAAHNQPGMTPAELSEMTMEDLREVAGITNTEYRELLYDELAKKHGSPWADEELDEIDIDQVEDFLGMERHEIDEVLDAAWAARQDHLQEDVPQSFSAEDHQRDAKWQVRFDLEDDVLASYTDLSHHEVAQMDTKVLENMLAEAIAHKELAKTGEQVEPDIDEVLAACDHLQLPPAGAVPAAWLVP
jgi:hypothetical protein